jgi:hypothetical protein
MPAEVARIAKLMKDPAEATVGHKNAGSKQFHTNFQFP